MNRQENKHSYTYHRFFQTVPIEILRRFAETLTIGVILSFIIKVVEYFGLITDNESYLVMHLLFFVSFEAITFFLCRKSSARMRYFGRYYAANFASYLLYILSATAFLLLLGILRYLWPFRITTTLLTSRIVSFSAIYKSILIFHSATLLVIFCSPKGGIIGLYRYLRHRKLYKDDSE